MVVVFGGGRERERREFGGGRVRVGEGERRGGGTPTSVLVGIEVCGQKLHFKLCPQVSKFSFRAELNFKFCPPPLPKFECLGRKAWWWCLGGVFGVVVGGGEGWWEGGERGEIPTSVYVGVEVCGQKLNFKFAPRVYKV